MFKLNIGGWKLVPGGDPGSLQTQLLAADRRDAATSAASPSLSPWRNFHCQNLAVYKPAAEGSKPLN